MSFVSVGAFAAAGFFAPIRDVKKSVSAFFSAASLAIVGGGVPVAFGSGFFGGRVSFSSSGEGSVGNGAIIPVTSWSIIPLGALSLNSSFLSVSVSNLLLCFCKNS